MKFIDRLKGWVQRMGAETKAAHEYRDVFELGGVPAYRQFYNNGIFVWKRLYRGYYAPWHELRAPTVADVNAKREAYRMNLAKAACAELAGLTWSEQCKINVNLKGFEPTENEPEDKAQRFIDSVLRHNNFGVKMQESIEQMLALGGLALKVWHDGEHIQLGYAMADQFVPTAWDNAAVKDGVFISREAKGGYYYTRLEWHKRTENGYAVVNELFRAEMKNGDKEPQDILGYRYPLAEVYPDLEAETLIEGLDTPLFCYARPPIANNLDDNSPLGVSIYGNALETLHALDICYDSFVREFRLGKKRIIVPARAVRTVVDPDTGKQLRYFDAHDETYEALASDDPNDLKISDNTVELRVEEHVSAINAFLAILCLQLGFSASTFSFDVKGGLKTATEVVSENSKTYKTIRAVHNSVEPAITALVRNIFRVAVLYDMEFEGEKVASWFGGDIDGGYECSTYWDDSVIEDKAAQIERDILLLSNGLKSKLTIMTTTLGMTEEQAEAEIKRIADESRIGALDVDRFAAFAVT